MFAEIDLGDLLWTLLVLLMLTVLVYLIARGDGIGERRLVRVGVPPPPPVPTPI